MREPSPWRCDVCDKRKTSPEAHRIMFVNVSNEVGNTKAIQLCPLDDNSASEFVICVACRKLLAEAQEKK
jgi:hypothetical protein